MKPASTFSLIQGYVTLRAILWAHRKTVVRTACQKADFEQLLEVISSKSTDSIINNNLMQILC